MCSFKHMYPPPHGSPKDRRGSPGMIDISFPELVKIPEPSSVFHPTPRFYPYTSAVKCPEIHPDPRLKRQSPVPLPAE